MKSNNCQLMLLSGALTVSFAAHAAGVSNKSIVTDDNRVATSSVNKSAVTNEPVKNTDANVYGHVKDAKTGEHLPYVVIQIKGTTIGTTTDKTGHFFLKNLPEGSFVIEAKYMGYSTQSQSITIKQDTSKELNFTLSPSDFSIDEVVVSANRNETKRRLAPNLVSVIGGNSSTLHSRPAWRRGSTSSRVCAPRTTARTADSPRCASTDLTATTRRYWWIRVPFSRL